MTARLGPAWLARTKAESLRTDIGWDRPEAVTVYEIGCPRGWMAERKRKALHNADRIRKGTTARNTKSPE